MKVILTQTVPGLGDAGAIKDVADGYARNFLFPKGLAVVATRGSVKQAEAQAAIYASRANKAQQERQKAAASLSDRTVVIRARAGSENRLYGSVTAVDVADALQAQHGLEVDRRKIELEPIHRLGTYTANVDLGEGVTAKFNVEVAPEVAGATGKAAAGHAPAGEAASAPQAQAATAAPEAAAGTASETPAEEAAEAEVEANPS